MTRGRRIAASIVAWVPIVFGIGYVSAGIIDGYMVTVGGVPPGQPMNWDDLAYPLPEAMFQAALGLGLIALGAVARFYVSRKRSAAS
jgi:hypothetical protein